MKKPRNRAAQDATLLNVRALKKRVKTLEVEMGIVLRTLGQKLKLRQGA